MVLIIPYLGRLPVILFHFLECDRGQGLLEYRTVYSGNRVRDCVGCSLCDSNAVELNVYDVFYCYQRRVITQDYNDGC